MMDFLNTYGVDLAMGIIVIAVVGYFVYLIRTKQMDKVQKWLLFGVQQAEHYIGSQSGEVKLQFVYTQFTAKFPILKTFITFKTFKKMVDKALDELEQLIQSYDAVDTTKKEGE